MPEEIHFACVLNLHQPAGNLEYLLDNEPWEAKQILWALDRIPRSIWGHEETAKVHVSLSGTLLETLANPEFQERVYGIVDCGSLLWYLQNTSIIDILGTGYYHPVLPLTPPRDWREQLSRWQGISRHLFARDNFHGFWPPEMGFCMELIPLLRELGYQYVLVDSEYVEPTGSMTWQDLRYAPHIARYDGHEIIVVVRDRELSDAQESGMDAGWFVHEVYQRTQWCERPPLVTTCTDGENGGWFRDTSEKANFWPIFYKPFLERVYNQKSCGIRPAFIHEYINKYGTFGDVVVRTGAWNTGWHHGRDFMQWTGSSAQRSALESIEEISVEIDAIRNRNGGIAVEPALWRLLRAQTSCNLYWGESWIHKCESDLEEVRRVLTTA